MFERLSGLAEEYARLEHDLADAAVHSDPERARALGRRYGELTPDELKIVWQLRRVLHALEPLQALEVLLDRMKGTKSNAEFLLQVQRTTVST